MKPRYGLSNHIQVFGCCELTDPFRYQVMVASGFLDNPLYAVLQEPIYARGAGATAWAAQRVLQEFPDFGPDRDPLLFTGEMIYPWMFEEISALRPFAEAANILAERDDWPPPFDPDRLAGNEVPVADAGEVLRIDRLVELDEAGERTWWVLDYKLRHTPQVLAEYRAQMLRYRAAVQALQPGAAVRCAFITGAGELVELE